MSPMPENFVPGPQFVICAKGKAAKEWQGNRFLRHLVQVNLQEYSDASKLERSFLVSKIVKMIRQDGGFVREIDGKWFEIDRKGDRNAREKIGQMFRDALHTQFKSSTKAKASIRRQRRRATSSSSSSNTSSSSGSSVYSNSQSSVHTPTPLPTSSFPITEVAFDSDVPPVTPSSVVYGKTAVELDFRDFEPLPLATAVVMNFDSSIRSDESSFDQAIDEMLLVSQSRDERDLFEPLPLF